MSEQIAIGSAGRGRIRDFRTGFLLAVVTFGLYEIWWYYRLNEELRAIGRQLGDLSLSYTVPAVSATAVAVNFAVFVPDSPSTELAIGLTVVFLVSLGSMYRFGRRVAWAEELYGIPADQRFRRAAFLMLFPGGLLGIPYFLWFWYVTRHQNELLALAADSRVARQPVPA